MTTPRPVRNENERRLHLQPQDGLPIQMPSDRDDGPALDAIVLSDMHLGSENSQTKPLIKLLSEILHGEIPAHRLILNGDVFDSIDFRRLRKTQWKVLSLIRKLSDKMDVVWVAGNHDGSANIISQLLGVRVLEECVLISGDRRIFLFHGHQYDRFILDHPVLTWVADTIYAVLQKLDRRHSIARLAKRSSKIFLRCERRIRAGARSSAAKHRCDAVICGHTHHAAADTNDRIAYYNCGCWTELPCHYLAVRDGQVELQQYQHTPEPVDSPEGEFEPVQSDAALGLKTLLPPVRKTRPAPSRAS